MNRSQIERISKALADKTRLILFEEISARGQMNCGEIVSFCGVTPATVSHHLKVLQEAGLIQCQHKGQFVYSRSRPEIIAIYTAALAKLASPKKSSLVGRTDPLPCIGVPRFIAGRRRIEEYQRLPIRFRSRAPAQDFSPG